MAASEIGARRNQCKSGSAFRHAFASRSFPLSAFLYFELDSDGLETDNLPLGPLVTIPLQLDQGASEQLEREDRVVSVVLDGKKRLADLPVRVFAALITLSLLASCSTSS